MANDRSKLQVVACFNTSDQFLYKFNDNHGAEYSKLYHELDCHTENCEEDVYATMFEKCLHYMFPTWEIDVRVVPRGIVMQFNTSEDLMEFRLSEYWFDGFVYVPT